MAVPPQLLFNAGLSPSTKSIELDFVRAVDVIRIPTAGEVRLAPVRRHNAFESPLPEWLFKWVRSRLEDHFDVGSSRGRLLYNGDIICIQLNTRGWKCGDIRFGRDASTNMLRLYFKALFPPSPAREHRQPYYVHARHSKCVLLEGSPVNGFVPPLMPHLFVPATMRPVADEICERLPKLLANDSLTDITPVLLVIGSVEQQRRLLAYVAELTGASLVAKNCWGYSSTLLGQSPTVDARRKEKLERALERARHCAPSFLWLRNIVEALHRGERRHDNEEGIHTLVDIVTKRQRCGTGPGFAVVFTCTLEEAPSLSKRLLQAVHFKYTLGVDALSDEERADFHQHCVASGQLREVERRVFVDSTRGLSLAEAERLVGGMCLAAAIDGREQPTAVELESGVERQNALLAQRNGALCHATIPRVGWDEVGGLDDAKQLLIESVRALTNTADVGGVRRSGILLHGPPGCGKTMLAKALASDFKLAFISVKGPELLNRYVGQSESNLRDVFHRARLSSPSAVFFDELDSLAPRRGVAGDSGGVMDRMVSQLLTELDSIHQRWGTGRVLVIGATNRPDLLDECLLKPGRFDTLIEVKPAATVDAREQILGPICKRMKLEFGLSARRVAELCPAGLSSGADLALLMSKAGMGAVRERIESLTNGDNGACTDVVILERHVEGAIKEITQSSK